MFYAEAILSKKGPLAKVWLAAHLERKLTKNQLLQASIPSSVGAIIGHDHGPPLALRLSGQLLLGVARIYARKARYLLEDCSEALIRIKMAFRPGAADITSDAVVATHSSITLPEALTEFDVLLPSAARLPGSNVEAFTSRLQDITLAEQQFDISAVARDAGAAGAGGGLDLLGRDDDFKLDLDEDFVLSPGPQQLAEPFLDGSALEPEVARDAMQSLNESIRPEDVSLFEKDMGAEESMMRLDIDSEPNTQEAALQVAEAEVLGAVPAAARPAKRRRLNLSELVTSTSLSSNEVRARLGDATDTVRGPTYLPATRAAKLDDMSASAVASRFLGNDGPFAALFAHSDADQQVPALFADEAEPEFNFQIEDELRFEDEPEAAAQQPEMLLADKSIEQLEKMEEESLVMAEQQQQKGLRLFAETAPEQETLTTTNHSKSTIRAIHILNEAAESAGVPASDTAAASNATSTLSYMEVVKEARRDDAVKLFFELLVLKTKDFIDIAQPAPYEDMMIVPRSKLKAAHRALGKSILYDQSHSSGYTKSRATKGQGRAPAKAEKGEAGSSAAAQARTTLTTKAQHAKEQWHQSEAGQARLRDRLNDPSLAGWQRRKIELKLKLGSQPWVPEKKIAVSSMEKIRLLNTEFPKEWTLQRLSEQFKISQESVRRILKSKFQPSKNHIEKRKRRQQQQQQQFQRRSEQAGQA
ncbi:sister chromatid cohesion protein 1 [Coemansia brasiliensis]|uniref:Sister chromatid cohesion protein 1 n=1 Tax=Coemansia brasiliensis TaxID=2650707 RepID=A0A9W8IC94_9FUNG|nr:sister chromatid cohesion protein 1 [Coemansia brasiliensis]